MVNKSNMTKQEALDKIYTISRHGTIPYGRILTSGNLIGSQVRLIEVPNTEQATIENQILKMFYQEHKTLEEIVAFLKLNNIPSDEIGLRKFLNL